MSSTTATSPPPRSGQQHGHGGFFAKLFRSKSATNDRRPSTSNEGGVFGVALPESLRYASVAISQVGDDGKPRIYGYIPVVVAKAGLFLKENGTTTPGIFRVSGSNKRIKELETIFDTPPSYGKDLDWDTFSVHDAASAFRRYLNMLPYPIIPFELYAAFQGALPRSETTLTPNEIATAVERYRVLINSLPPASQHIFFYTLDLLSVFHNSSAENLMPASNLATIFQPGLLRHPSTSQSAAPSTDPPPVDADAVKAVITADAAEHKRSQEVLVFLIEHHDAFELELPKRVTKSPGSSSASPTSPKPSTSKGGSDADDEGWSMLPKPAPVGVGRRQSQTKRLRRKSHDPSAQSRPARPSADSKTDLSSSPSTSAIPEGDERKGWSSPWRSRKSFDTRRPNEDEEVARAVARVGLIDPPPGLGPEVKAKKRPTSPRPSHEDRLGTSPASTTTGRTGRSSVDKSRSTTNGALPA